jgi:hypothetical protein
MKIERGDLKMRKHTVLMALVLAFSVMVGIQLATSDVRANGIKANVDIDPDSLLLKEEGYGKWITAYIGLPEGYNVNNIDVSSVTLWVMGNPVWRVQSDIQGNKLMVKFDRVRVVTLLWSMIDHMSLHIKEKGPLELEVTGKLDDGTTFRGKDTIRVFFTQP